MVHSSIYIIGASGHAGVVIQLARACDLTIIGILDDDIALHGKSVMGIPVLGGVDSNDYGIPAIIAIGDNRARQSAALKINRPWLTLIHPTAIVDTTAIIGRGSVIMAGAVVQAYATVGQHAIVNTAASIDHDCVLNDFCHICPGVVLPGNVNVGRGALVGARSTSIPGIAIGSWVTVGAGSTVISDVKDDQTVVGSPAKVSRAATLSARGSVRLSQADLSALETNLLLEVFDSNSTISDDCFTTKFENEFAAMFAVGHAVSLVSGTAAFRMALEVLDVTAGDEVIMPTLMRPAAALAVVQIGATLSFVDSAAATWNMDPVLLDNELCDRKEKGKLPKVVIITAYMGQCSGLCDILDVCKKYRIPTIEDASDTIGVTCSAETPEHFGSVRCFSFDGSDTLSMLGGGMLVSRHKTFTERARQLSMKLPVHQDLGAPQKNAAAYPRLHNLPAAVGRGQLLRLSEFIQARRSTYARYHASLSQLSGIKFMPGFDADGSACWQICVSIDAKKFGASRDDILGLLRSKRIETAPLPQPLHRRPEFQPSSIAGGKVADQLYANSLCLPSSSALKTAEIDRVINDFSGLFCQTENSIAMLADAE